MNLRGWKWASLSGHGSGELGTSGHMRSLAVALLVLVGAGTSAALAAPPNDDFVDAATITSLPFSATENTVDATTEADEPYCGSQATVWYAFTPPVDMWISSNTFGSSYDTALGVYTGAPGSFSEVACNDDSAYGYQSRVAFEASAGETYFFMVGACCGPGGDLVFSVDEVLPPSNDDFADAVVADTLPFVDTRSTFGATWAADDSTDCFIEAPTVWYAFTPAENMRILAHTAGSDYDTVLNVYTGARGSLTQVACSYYSPVLLDVVAGETYFFMVMPTAGPGGNLMFSIQEGPSVLAFEVKLDRVSSFNSKTGEATVRGTATCNQPAWVDLWGNLRQTVGRLFTISGDFWQSFECNGVTPWKATLTPYSGKFAGGRANASVFACAYIEFEGACDEAPATITLQGGKQKPAGKPTKPKK
jgi:hypothetical protein